MSEPCGSRDTPTILDYLNEDCWRAILDYVPIKDIIKSELVCSRWQRVILVYLRGLRIGIEHPYPSLGSNELHRSVSWLLVRDHKPHTSLELWTNKLGSSVASTFCDTEECLRIIGENCPNLEAVKFMNLPDQLLRSSRTEHFRWLQRICFIKCPTVSDACVREYASSYVHEELEIHHNKVFTGQCLRNIKPDLKSLVLNQCRALDYWNLLAALDRFCELTKLVLDLYTIPFKLRVMYKRNMTVSVSRLHKLEYLEIYGLDQASFIEAVCSLKNLKHLGGDIKYTDEELEKVSMSCRNLQSLEFVECYRRRPYADPPAHGLRMMCQNIRLTALGFRCFNSDNFILTCVAVCPDLIRLHIGKRYCISSTLVADVADVRRRLCAPCPLHVFFDTNVLGLTEHGMPKIYVTDCCVSEYATSYALEELEIHHNQRLTGECLKKIKPNLKSLVLNKCRSLDYRHLYAGLDRFRNLTKLVLNLYTDRFGLHRNIPQALNGLHKLEHLELYCQNTVNFYSNNYFGTDSYLIEAVCRLKNLRHLGGEIVHTDKQLEKVCRCCTELRSLDLENCHGVTSHGVAMLCRDMRLTALGFHKCGLSEDDILACVNALPDLTRLDVRRNQLSRGLIARVAAARQRQCVRRPLHFCIDNIILDLRLNGDLDKYEQLILHF